MSKYLIQPGQSYYYLWHPIILYNQRKSQIRSKTTSRIHSQGKYSLLHWYIMLIFIMQQLVTLEHPLDSNVESIIIQDSSWLSWMLHIYNPHPRVIADFIFVWSISLLQVHDQCKPRWSRMTTGLDSYAGAEMQPVCFETLCPILVTTVIGFTVERRVRPHNATKGAAIGCLMNCEQAFLHRFCSRSVLPSWI